MPSLKFIVVALFFARVLYVHLRGRVRLPLLRQLFNHSAVLAPLNALLDLFSAVPARPYPEGHAFFCPTRCVQATQADNPR